LTCDPPLRRGFWRCDPSWHPHDTQVGCTFNYLGCMSKTQKERQTYLYPTTETTTRTFILLPDVSFQLINRSIHLFQFKQIKKDQNRRCTFQTRGEAVEIYIYIYIEREREIKKDKLKCRRNGMMAQFVLSVGFHTLNLQNYLCNNPKL